MGWETGRSKTRKLNMALEVSGPVIHHIIIETESCYFIRVEENSIAVIAVWHLECAL